MPCPQPKYSHPLAVAVCGTGTRLSDWAPSGVTRTLRETKRLRNNFLEKKANKEPASVHGDVATIHSPIPQVQPRRNKSGPKSLS